MTDDTPAGYLLNLPLDIQPSLPLEVDSMKIRETALAVALVMLFSVAARAQEKNGSAPSTGAPRLAIESFTHDFGEVKAGTPLKYSFKIKNEGTADLLVKNVAPG
jgi:hypothetical protein